MNVRPFSLLAYEVFHAMQNSLVEAERHLRGSLAAEPFADAEIALARLREQRSQGR